MIILYTLNEATLKKEFWESTHAFRSNDNLKIRKVADLNILQNYFVTFGY